MKVYGTPEHVGFLIKRDPKTKKAVSKHYISAVERNSLFDEKLVIFVRGPRGDIMLTDYEVGYSKNVDNAIRAWLVSRSKARLRRPELTKSQNAKLFKKKK